MTALKPSLSPARRIWQERGLKAKRPEEWEVFSISSPQCLYIKYGSASAQPRAIYSIVCPCRPVIRWGESNFHVTVSICLQSVCAFRYQFHMKCCWCELKQMNWVLHCLFCAMMVPHLALEQNKFGSSGSLPLVAIKPLIPRASTFSPCARGVSCGWSRFLTHSKQLRWIGGKELPIGVIRSVSPFSVHLCSQWRLLLWLQKKTKKNKKLKLNSLITFSSSPSLIYSSVCSLVFSVTERYLSKIQTTDLGSNFTSL